MSSIHDIDKLRFKVAYLYFKNKSNRIEEGRKKTAGEVVFRKDNSGDANQWAYNNFGPEKRKIQKDFNYSPKNMKPLAEVLRSSAAALGHLLSAQNKFTKIKSAKVSPDGNLGGKGYIMKISDIRKQLFNAAEALSSISDTLYDEVNAPHWSVLSRQESDEDKIKTQELIKDTEKIRENPEEWAEEEMDEEFGD
jgi:hypothetical protein